MAASEDQSYTSRATMSLDIVSARKRMADTQTRVFTKWINARLTQLAAQHKEDGVSDETNPVVLCDDLLSDLQDGTLLINLTQAVTGKKLRVNKDKTKAHHIANIQEALQCLSSFGVNQIGITEHLIYEGSSKAILGLIWKIFIVYNRKQMAGKHPLAATPTGQTVRKELLSWCQKNLMKYKSHGVEVTDFGPSWKDGLAFIALLHQFKPGQVNIDDVKEMLPSDRLKVAFTMAEKEFGVEQLLLPEDLELFPDKEKDGSGSPPRKQVDESPVLTYISELHNHLVKQFPDISDSESEPQTKCVHGLKLLPLESWIIEGEGLVKEEPDLGVEGEDSDASPLISKIEVHLETSDTILSDTSSNIDDNISSLPPNDAQELQDRYMQLKQQWTTVKGLLTVRLTELRFKECAADIHRWVSESESLLMKLKSKEACGCVQEVEEQISQYKEVFNEDITGHGQASVDRLSELAEQLNSFETWNRPLETRTVLTQETKKVNAMAGGIAEYGQLLREWMNQWQTIERDCATLDGWLAKAELLLGRREDAETSFAVAPQAFMDSYQDVLRMYTAQRDVLTSLETSLEQLGADANERAKVEMLKKRFKELEENDMESWLKIYQLFFDKVLAWISRADQVVSLSVEDLFREKSPPSMCQELLDQLPEVQQAFTKCEEKANGDPQCAEWFNEQLMASKLKLPELQQQLNEQLENVRISCEGGEEFNEAVTKLEEKIEEAEELISQDLDSEKGMSVTVALEKYRALCHPDWLQDGNKIFKEAEESADQIMKSGKSRGAALLEQKLVDLSKAWENVKSQLVLQRRSLEFQVLQTQLDSHLDDGLHELDGLDFLGPLENLLQQEQSYREFFEGLQFESVAKSHLKKLLELTEEEKQESPGGDYDQIDSLSGRLRDIMELATSVKDKLDELINRWTAFETEKNDVEMWIEENGRQLSELSSSCENEWNAFGDIDKALQQAMQLAQEVDKYEDSVGSFIGSGEQLKDECDAKQAIEHENGVKNLEDRYEQLRLEVDELTRPLTALHSSWHSFITVSDEVVDWLDKAYGLLQECSEVEGIKEAEHCVKRHKDFFTPQMLKLQNSRLTHLTQLLQEVTSCRGGDHIHRPSHLSDQLQNLNDRYTHICQLQQSELEFLETLWHYLQVAADISQYLHEVQLLLSKLDSNSQSPDNLQRLQSMLHELIPKQERLRKLKEMHSKLEQIGEGKNVPLSLDDMRLQFEEIKTKQAALFERRETEEEAEELIGDVRQDIERARETLKYEIECEAEKETAQIKRLEEISTVLNSHKNAVSDLIGKLTDRGGSQSSFQQELTELKSQLAEVTGDLMSVEDICQEALVLADDMTKVVKEVEDQVSKVDTALEIPWRKDSTSRRWALRDCQTAVSVAQISRQQSNLSVGRESLNALSILTSSNHLLRTTDILNKSETDWKDAVNRGHGRIQMIQFEQLMLEAREKINTADAHLKQLEPILGPTSRIEEQLQSHLEYFLDDFETSMDSVRNSLSTFMESSPLEGDELTKKDVQEKSDELRIQTEALQSEHKRLKVSMETALTEWQKFDKKRNEFSDWLKRVEKQFEELRDKSGEENDREGKLKGLVAEIESKEISMKHVLDIGHSICQACVEPDGSHTRQVLSELKRQFDQLRNQASAVAEAESQAAAQIAEYRGKAELLQAWLDDVDNRQLAIADKEYTSEEDKKVLQGILHEEVARRQELTSLEASFDVLSHDPSFSSQIEYDLTLDNTRNRFDGSLRAVRRCLVAVMLNEADEVLSRGDIVVGDQERFTDALEEQEAFFADSNHLENVENILQELEASSVHQDQTDGDTQTDTEDLKRQLNFTSAKEPQVHRRLASAIAAWKEHDVLQTKLDDGTVQCREELAECQGIPAVVSPQEVTDKVAQLDNAYEHNNQLFSVARALQQQIDLLAALATPEQHKNISNTMDALYNGLEETSRTIGDLKNSLKEHLESADKRAKAVERHSEKLERRISELDTKVSSLPAIEYDVEPLNDLSQSVEMIQDELDGYRTELETLQQSATDLNGFLDSSVTEQLQTLDSHLDNLSAGVAGKDAEVSAAARRTQDVTEKLDTVEDGIRALTSHFEGDLQDHVGTLELSAVQEYLENLQGCCRQLQELRPELDDCLKPFPAQGRAATRALEMRAEALSSQIETAVNRGFSQLKTLADIRDKLSQVESDTKDISLWTEEANETMALVSSPRKQLEELDAELEEKKAVLSNIRVTANTLTSTYPHIDSQALSNLMADARPKLHKVQDTLAAKYREKSPSEENGLEVDMEMFDNLYNPVMVYLEDIETRLQSQEFDVTDDIQEVEWKLNCCQAIQSDMDAHTPDYDQVCAKADELKLGLTESQHPTLDRKLKELNDKWVSVADLLTNTSGDLRDRLEELVRDTEVVAGLEAWLDEKKQRLRDLNDSDSQSSDSSDTLFELEELAVQISERKATLERSNEEGAADLANRYGKFGNDVNNATANAKARVLGEEPWNTHDNVIQRIGRLESQLAVLRDVTGLSSSEAAEKLSQVKAIDRSGKELRQEIEDLQARECNEELESGGLESGHVDVSMLGEQLDHLDRLMSEVNKKRQELEAGKGVEEPDQDLQASWNYFPLFYILALLLLLVCSIVIAQGLLPFDQDGMPLGLRRESVGPAQQ